jgi:hypothetical protein
MAEEQQLKSSNVKVYIRLRPASEQETRVIQKVSETNVTIQSAVSQGYAFAFDGVLDENASQAQVYDTTCRHFAQHLSEGYHCSLIACGEAQTGKTHTLLTLPTGNSKQGNDQNGLIARLSEAIFAELQQKQVDECTVRLCVAELYLESLRDLLGTGEHARVQNGCLVGLTKLSCVSSNNITDAVRRAQLIRTISQSDPEHYSDRSTLLVQITLDIIANSRQTSSRLLIVDMASDTQSPQQETLLKLVQQRNERQLQHGLQVVPSEPELPLIAKLLFGYSLGAPSLSTVIVCASPSQPQKEVFQFGLECLSLRNTPSLNLHHSWHECLDFQKQATDRQHKFERVTRALAAECIRLQQRTTGDYSGDRSLWTMIEEIQKCTNEERPIEFAVQSTSEHEQQSEIMRLKSDLRRVKEERDQAQAHAAKLHSDLSRSKIKFESLNELYLQQKELLDGTRSASMVLNQRKQEVEHNLRTSLFRESEAVIFLRQFRKFYFRILTKMEAEGTGNVLSIINGIPGAPDLSEMVDLDTVMMDSGLLEEDEIGKDKSFKDYRPSRAALTRSADAVKMAVDKMSQVPGEDGGVFGVTGVRLSIVQRHETGEATEARHRLYQTPSGRYIDMREKLLEKELLDLSSKVIHIEQGLQHEKAVVAALIKNDSDDKAVLVREKLALQEKLDRKEKDWNAVVWKMNELHLSAKDGREKVDNREQHITYLEQTLSSTQDKNAHVIQDRQILERRLNREMADLRKQVHSIGKQIWHLEENGSSRPPLHSRIVLPFSTAPRVSAMDPDRRVSLGNLEKCVDRYIDESGSKADAQTQTDVISLPTIDDIAIPSTHDTPCPLLMTAPVKEKIAVEESIQTAPAPRDELEELPKIFQLPTHDTPCPLLMTASVRGMSVVEESIQTAPAPRYEFEELPNHFQRAKEPAQPISYPNAVRYTDKKPDVLGATSLALSDGSLQSEVTCVPAHPATDSGPTISPEKTHDEAQTPMNASTTSLMHSEHTADAPVPAQSLNATRWKKSSALIVDKEVPIQAKQKLTSAEIMRKLQAKGQRKDDKDGGVPEFMRKFKTIGAKNAKESVIETAGAQAARPLTRTAYGKLTNAP